MSDDFFSSSSDFGSLLSKKEDSLKTSQVFEHPQPVIIPKSQPQHIAPIQTLPTPMTHDTYNDTSKSPNTQREEQEFVNIRQEFSQMAKGWNTPKSNPFVHKEENEQKDDFFGGSSSNFSDFLNTHPMHDEPKPESKPHFVPHTSGQQFYEPEPEPIRSEPQPLFVQPKPVPIVHNIVPQPEPQQVYNVPQHVHIQPPVQQQHMYPMVEVEQPKQQQQLVYTNPNHSKSQEVISNYQHQSMPRNNSSEQIRTPKFQEMTKTNPQQDMESIKKFPGPIKNPQDVSIYINTRITSQSMSTNDKYLWKVLEILMCAQNEADQVNLIRRLIGEEINDKMNSGFKSNSRPKGEIQKYVLDVQKLLMEGKIEEGCNIAMEYGLWAHALLLSSMMDKKTYQKVVVKFATTAFYDGSPMQTLYLMFAEKGEFIFSSNEEMNLLESWKENILIVLSNRTTSSGTILEKLGNKLWAEYGDVSSAHFSYICADYFAKYDARSKIVLVGADHINYPNQFVTVDTIQRTEIWEYVKMQQNPQFLLPKFQEYKLLYAKWLNQAGLIQKAYDYVRSIKGICGKNQQAFGPKFLEELNQFEKTLVSTGKVSTGSGTGSWIFDSFSKLIHGDESPVTTSSNPVVEQKPVLQEMKTETTPIKKQPVLDSGDNSGSGWFGWLPFTAKGKKDVNLGKANAFVYDQFTKKWIREGQQGQPQQVSQTPPPNSSNQQNWNQPPPMMTPPPSMGSDVFGQTRNVGGYVDVFNTGPKQPKPQHVEDLNLFTQPQVMTGPPKGSFFRPPTKVVEDQQPQEEYIAPQQKMPPTQNGYQNEYPTQTNHQQAPTYHQQGPPMQSPTYQQGPPMQSFGQQQQLFTSPVTSQPVTRSGPPPMESTWLKAPEEKRTIGGPPMPSWNMNTK